MQAGNDLTSWTDSYVAEYLQTAQSGFPYISCPDELRPSSASIDSWWVIYAPSVTGGAIVEGVRIEQWRIIQQRVLIFWGLIGLVVFYGLAFGGYLWGLFLFGIFWISVLPLGGYVLLRRGLSNSRWIHFPSELSIALQQWTKQTEEDESRRYRRKTVTEGVGKMGAGVVGVLVEAAAGKAVGKASEIAVEAAYKALMKHAGRDTFKD
jgi:hypothetical protein